MESTPGAPTTSTVGNGVDAASLSVQFDAWGDLTQLQQWNTHYAFQTTDDGQGPDAGNVGNGIVASSATSLSDAAYRYDALGRRISDGGSLLYYDAAGNVIEERSSTSAVEPTAQYVYSPVNNTLILRDRNVGATGNIGINGSGLSERRWPPCRTQGSTDAHSRRGARRRQQPCRRALIYTNPPTLSSSSTATAATAASARKTAPTTGEILYHGSRDDARFSSSDFYYLNGVEWNSSTGLPVQEDPFAYVSQKHSYDATVAAEAVGAFDTWFANNAGTIAATIKVGSWLGGPILGYAVNFVADVYERAAPVDNWKAQSALESVGGGFADVTGIGGLYGWYYGKDIITNSTDGWSNRGERNLRGFLGLLQFLPIVGAGLRSIGGMFGGGVQGGGAALSNGSVVLNGAWSPALAFASAGNALGAFRYGFGKHREYAVIASEGRERICAVTGPKTDNRFGHNRTIRQVARQVTANGEQVIAGGRMFDGVYRREAIFETIGGFKNAHAA